MNTNIMTFCMFIIAICLFCTSCSDKYSPVQVKGEQKFGRYVFTPPEGYWFFPKKYSLKNEISKNNYLVTFWKDKDDMLSKKLKEGNVLINFGVSKNMYKDFSEYYNQAQKAGVTYNDIPKEMQILTTVSNWSCKETVQSIFGVECISLGDDLVTFGLYGNEKSEVITNLPVLKKMLESFKSTHNP